MNCRLNLRLKILNNRGAEQGCPVLATLAVMNRDRHQGKIYVLDTQPEALINAKSAAIENFYNEPVSAVKMAQNLANLINRQNSGQVALLVSEGKTQLSKFNTKELVVKIDQRVKAIF